MGDSHPAATSAEAQEWIRVLAAVIERQGTVLICRRPAHKRHGGLWEFPGGKLEEREGLTEAAHRELAEELAVLVVSVGEALYRMRDPGSRLVIEFAAVEISGEPAALEHDEIRWVAPAELFELELAPSDAIFRDARWKRGNGGTIQLRGVDGLNAP